MSELCVIILAAGKGTRMKSDLQKVLHQLLGKPMIHHLVEEVRRLEPVKVLVVVGHQKEEVMQRLEGLPVEFVEQTEMRGTGDAVRRAVERLPGYAGEILVLCGDSPLLRSETLLKLLELHRREGPAATLLTARLENPTGYGRIKRNGTGLVEAIVEQADATDEERRITEVNSGVYVFAAPRLFETLPGLRPDNAKGEYYLTDVIKFLRTAGERVAAQVVADPSEILGVNTPEELERARQILARRRQS
ncbi:MAG TPA: NTP transferase domain-containing protein [bacterium]|uniref:Bifunctional protein GlmU n=1 Tax=candidate division TA06 bacterium ADurb.Bin417 TaxID=1852828 RepID=A0A1V5MI17_UNCT6|nr:MAG: Bifunctional protein GlmU [candidate division TA06 bacterium ADurb.Bin417]HNQ35794.1 NTP transferase domain-containing protein [bacterium]HNS49263.1 NTP transferase domain-containing protein [bacterium]